MVYTGTCHCGALSYRYATRLPVSRWSVRACQCSFCRRHRAVSTSDPKGTVEFAVQEASLVQRYRFGKRTADFLICRQCGAYVGAVRTSAAGSFGIVNLNMLLEPPDDLLEPAPVSYDDDTLSTRSTRRETRWTPAVVR